MADLSRLELLMNLGFRSDPFRSALFETGDSVRILRIIDMAARSNAIVSIVGERGAGKTRAVNVALKAVNARPVMVRSADKTRLLISDIEQAMIMDLSEEKPMRGREIRTRQLRRVLGEASRKQKVVVVIEEAHRLHGMTLRALKTLRELDWMGKTELFSIVLLGQSDPMNKAGVAEVRLRSDCVHMHGMAAVEIAGYIENTVGGIFDEKAIDAVSKRPEARNFLDLQNLLVCLMGNAVADGRKQVGLADVEDIFGKKAKRAGRITAEPTPKKKAASPVKEGNKALRSVLGGRTGSDAGNGLSQAV